MNDLLAAAPAILSTVAAAAAWYLTRGRSERGQAAGTFGFAVLLALATVLALWGLLSIGMDGFHARTHLGFLERLTVAVDAVQDAAISGRLPGLAFVAIIAAAVLLPILLSTEITNARRILFPSSRLVADGPWKGGFLSDAEISDLIRLDRGLPLGLTARGKMVRYAKNDARGWLGGHHAVISATRGGKGVSVIMPAIFDHDGPVVALDIKGELAQTTHKRRQAKGQTVIVLDPFATSGLKTSGFNPMAFIRAEHRDRDAAIIADGLVRPETGSGSHFSDRARACLQTAIEVVHELDPKPTLHDVRNLILSDRFLDTLTAWAETPELAGGRAANLAGSFLAMGDKERGSILSTVAKALEWTAAGPMRSFLAAEDGFDLAQLLDGKHDLFIVVPLDQVGPQAGFMRLMANLLLALMVQQDRRGKAARTVLFVADEFTRLGRLERFSDIATVAAGIGLEALFVLQDKKSLEAIYPDADTILASCATVRLFNLGRGDRHTAEWASGLTGHKTVRTESVSTSTGTTSTNVTAGEAKEPLLTVADILEIPSDQVLCLMRGKRALLLRRIIYYDHPLYREHGAQ